MAGYAGLPSFGGVDGTKYFLTRAERSLMQWAVLDGEGQVLVQKLAEPMPTEADLGSLYVQLEAMDDAELIDRFAALVTGCEPSSHFLFVYDACRLEVRWLLPRLPYADAELARRRDGFGMEAASVERRARLLNDAGVSCLLACGCMEPSERVCRMLIGVVNDDGHVGDDAVAVLREMWLGLVSAVDPADRGMAYLYSGAVALALADALSPLFAGRGGGVRAYPDARQFLFERG
ncbi:MAG: hypothetical protein U0N15_01255 [Bifidobacterium choerinum]